MGGTTVIPHENNGSMLERVTTALAELDELELDGLSAAELNEAVEQMQRLRGRFEAAEARVLARWDPDRCWQLDEPDDWSGGDQACPGGDDIDPGTGPPDG